MKDRSFAPPPVQAFGTMLDKGIDQLACRTAVSPADIQLVQHLRDEILAWTGAMYRSARMATDLSVKQGWGWLPFHDDESLRLGLLTLHSGQPISIHDHPGSTGLLVVLEGTLRVTNYQCAEPVNTAVTRQMVNLSEIGQQQLGAGDCAIFDPTEGNIHAVATDIGPCVVLDILLSPYTDDERGWYMPLDDNGISKGKFSAMRLSRAPSAHPDVRPHACTESHGSAAKHSFQY